MTVIPEEHLQAASTTRWVYSFGGGAADGDAKMKNLLGGKGANLAEMSSLGLPVPPGPTITTEACVHYYAEGKSYPAGLQEQVDAALSKVEGQAGKRFGDSAIPLLVSVRSGARASMPGMMDTVLNLGLNDETVEGLSRLSGDRRFAFDSYRPVHPDVLQRGAGAGAQPVRGDPRRPQGTSGGVGGHRPDRR